MTTLTRKRRVYDLDTTTQLRDIADSAICNIDDCHPTSKHEAKRLYDFGDKIARYEITVTVKRIKVK